MSVKTTQNISRTDALNAIYEGVWKNLLSMTNRRIFIEKSGEFFDWREKFLFDRRFGDLEHLENKLEEVRDIHNSDSPYYFENYIVKED